MLLLFINNTRHFIVVVPSLPLLLEIRMCSVVFGGLVVSFNFQRYLNNNRNRKCSNRQIFIQCVLMEVMAAWWTSAYAHTHTHTRARLYKISLSLEQQHLDQITDEKYFSIESDCKAAYFSYLSSSAAFCLFHLPSRLLSASFYFI